MPVNSYYILKKGILDVMSGNRINGIMNTTYSLTPDMFVNSATTVQLSSFLSCDFYNGSGCTGAKISSSKINVTPGNSNYFNFTLTNLGSDPLIYGFAIVALTSPISIYAVRTSLGYSYTSGLTLSGLCTSSLVNKYSPNKPNVSSPYSLSSFNGYCKLASGGVNIYAQNGITVQYYTGTTFYGCATNNQINYSSLKLDIQMNGISLATVTKTGSTYIELTTPLYSNPTTFNLTGSCATICSYLSGSTWSELSRVTQIVTLLGIQSIELMYLTIGSPSSKLTYQYFGMNGFTTYNVYIRVMNTTRSSTYQISSIGSTSGVLNMNVSNVSGDSFTCDYSNDSQTTWHSVYLDNPNVLSFDWTL